MQYIIIKQLKEGTRLIDHYSPSGSAVQGHKEIMRGGRKWEDYCVCPKIGLYMGDCYQTQNKA